MDVNDLNGLGLDLEAITDPGLRRCVIGLLNIIEQQARLIEELREEIRKLRDENARLKGEQGRPDVKPNQPAGATGTNHSSEKRRQERKPRSTPREAVPVDRTVPCPVDRETLPVDAQYKGTETTVIQDVVFRRDNVAFEREKFYSPSEGKTYLGPLPPGYEGHRFGPGVRSLVLVLYYGTGTSEPKILELLDHVGVRMSAGELSNLLIQDVEEFHQEKGEVLVAGLESSPWQQIDDTATRVDGVNQHCHVLCNPLYAIYQTLPAKDRPAVLAVLRGIAAPRFLVNEEAVTLAARLGVSGRVLSVFQKRLPWGEEMDEATFTERFEAALSEVGEQTKRKLYEAAALASYRGQSEVPIVRTLLGDDARQFDGLTEGRALCWVHEGRHYAKLTPFVPQFEAELASVQDGLWEYYRELATYRSAPSAEEAARLSQRFDEVFTTPVIYQDLAERMQKTLGKKAELLSVLSHPELPLHNNASELEARQRVRKRDVSFGPRTVAGAKAWDTFQSLVATAKKLGVSAYEYFADRVGGVRRIPSLGDLIHERAKEMNLGASWVAPQPDG